MKGGQGHETTRAGDPAGGDRSGRLRGVGGTRGDSPQGAPPAQAQAAKAPFANLKAQIDLLETTADFKATAGGFFSRKQIHIRFTLSHLMSFGSGKVPKIVGIETVTINRKPVQPEDLLPLATAIEEADQLLQILPIEYINRGPGSNRLAKPLANALRAYRP